jgi:hypothetical protein
MELKHGDGRSLPFTRRMMAGLEEGGRMAEQAIVACGIRVGIRTDRSEFLDRLLALIPNIWKPSSASSVERLFFLRASASGSRKNRRSWYELYEDRQMVASSGDLEEVMETFERQLKIYLAEMARRRVFAHAGVVGWQGKAIIIPGRSFSGKTSLVAELVRAGATYYSDECAVLDKYGRAHPYSAPLAVREPGSFKQKRCQAEEFGGRNGFTPLPVGLVVVSQYKPGERWRPRQLSAGQAMLELLANTVPARRKPEVVMTTLEKVVSQALVLKGARGEADETARLILESKVAGR